MTLVVRAATTADTLAIAKNHVACWRESYTGVVPQPYLDAMDVEERHARWGARLLVPGSTTVLAMRDDVVVGHAYVATAARDDAPVGLELRTLYVRASEHGTGLGARLLHSALGEQAAYLWVYEANVRARAFYAKHGFRPDGTAKVDHQNGVPELRMVRARRRRGEGSPESRDDGEMGAPQGRPSRGGSRRGRRAV